MTQGMRMKSIVAERRRSSLCGNYGRCENRNVSLASFFAPFLSQKRVPVRDPKRTRISGARTLVVAGRVQQIAHIDELIWHFCPRNRQIGSFPQTAMNICLPC